MNKKLTMMTAVLLALCLTGCNTSTGGSGTDSTAANGSEIAETTAADSADAGETTASSAADSTDTTTAAATTEVTTADSAVGNAKSTSTAAADDSDYQNRISDIAGEWFEDGTTTLDPRTLTVNANGTFTLQYKGGGAMNGKIKVTAEEHPDGSSTLWFNFYDEGGDLWTSFQESQAQVQNDLYSGQDGELHFFRAESLPEGDAEDIQMEPRFKGDDYVGVWGCGRCSLTVEKSGDGYDVQIQWASSAADGTFWNYHCYYDPETWHLHCDGTGTRTDYSYADAEAEPENTVQYTNGSAEFWRSDDGCLYWNDKTENAGDGMDFIR